MGIPEGERGKETERLFKQIIGENVLNIWKDQDLGNQEAKRTSNYLNAKRTSPRHIILKLSNVLQRENSQGKRKRKLQPIKKIPLD